MGRRPQGEAFGFRQSLTFSLFTEPERLMETVQTPEEHLLCADTVPDTLTCILSLYSCVNSASSGLGHSRDAERVLEIRHRPRVRGHVASKWQAGATPLPPHPWTILYPVIVLQMRGPEVGSDSPEDIQ